MKGMTMKGTYPRKIRQIIIDQSMRAHVGHIGSSLSIADLIAVLYESVLNITDPDHPERDRFILSKGHAALALYGALHLKGWVSEEDLATYCADASLLGTHPEHLLRGVDFSTGSLGQGLSMAVGAALAAKKQGSERRVYVLLSDAECNEGSVWEAIMFAAHHKLDNLIAIVDDNGQQAMGYTSDVINLTPLAERWRAFGWDVQEVDGHNTDAIKAAIDKAIGTAGKPHVLLAKTTFGKGVSFMHNEIKWHYLPLSQEQYDQACLEVAEAK
jgi:transketolase